MSIRKVTEVEFIEVMNRIMELAGLTQQDQVADILNYSASALSQSKKRGSLPVNRLLATCKARGWDFDYVVYGKGATTSVSSEKSVSIAVNGGSAHVDVHHHDDDKGNESISGYDPMDNEINRKFLADWLSLDEIEQMRFWTLLKEAKQKTKE